jgi:hypothetical protein
MALSGKVLWQKYARDEEKWISGIEFEALNSRSRKLLTDHSAQLLKSGNRWMR